MVTRTTRKMIVVMSLVAFAVLAVSAFGPVYAEDRLVVATWGGHFGESLRKSVAEPFEKKYGCKVEFSLGVSSDQVAKVRAQRMKPQVDVVMVTADNAARMAEQKLTVSLPVDKVPNLKNLYPAAIGKDNGYVGMYGYDIGLCWRTDKLDLNLTKWADLWTNDLKKRFGLPYAGWTGMRFLLTVAKIAGGSEFNINPGFAKLKELKPQIGRVWKGDAEQHQLLSSGEIWVTPIMAPDARKLIEKGVPLKFIRAQDGIAAMWDTMSVVKNCPNPDLAFKFVDFALNAEAQKGHCEATFTIPMRKGVTLSEKVAKMIPTVEELERLFSFDDGQVNKMRDEWTERYNKEILTF
jgi:putative spermidine/putrescine transport system substrate-binding protein